MTKDELHFFKPYWPQVPSVTGFSVASARDAADVTFRGSSEAAVAARTVLEAHIRPVEPIRWLDQPHGANVVRLPEAGAMDGDGAVTRTPRIVCAMRSADCLPILFTSMAGDVVGVAHAGWKGFRAGIIQSTIRALECPPSEVLAWLGPAISRPFYETSIEVRDQFVGQDHFLAGVFIPSGPDKFQMDLYAFARNILAAEGVLAENVSGGDLCCFSDHRLHSVRRDGDHAGRMATVIWIAT